MIFSQAYLLLGKKFTHDVEIYLIDETNKYIFQLALIFLLVAIDLSHGCDSLPDVVKHCKRTSCGIQPDENGVEREMCKRKILLLVII